MNRYFALLLASAALYAQAPVAPFILYPVNGGSGAGTFTAHGVLLGEATNPFGVAPPLTAGWCFTSNGPSVDPSFQPCAGGGGSFPTTVAHGGTGGDFSAIAKGGMLAGIGGGALDILPASSDGKILSLDSTAATGLKWIAAAGGGTVTSISFSAPLTGGTISGSGTVGCPTCLTASGGILPYSGGGTNASTAWTQGSILFAGASAFAQDNANLFWDATNHRLGIGTTGPSRKLYVAVSGSASSTNQVTVGGYQAAFEVFNAAATANWYFGVNDADQNALYIGTGYSPGQGINPTLAMLGGGGGAGVAFFGVGPTAWGNNYGQVNIVANSDNVAWFRRTSANEGLIRFDHYNNGGATPQAIFAMEGYRGTVASPTTVQSGDILGVLDWRGYDGTIISDTAAQIMGYTTQTWTNVAHGAAMKWSTTPNGSITPVVRMIIDQTGKVGIGPNNPNSLLEIALTNGDPTVAMGNTASATGGAHFPQFQMYNYDGTGFGGAAILNVNFSRGSSIAPTATQSGDILGYIQFQGMDNASTFRGAGYIQASAAGTFTSSSAPGKMSFFNTRSSSVTPTLAMSIQKDQSLDLAPRVFSTLDACAAGTEGAMAAITDSTTNTWGATVTGGGANHIKGYCDGSNWTVAAK